MSWTKDYISHMSTDRIKGQIRSINNKLALDYDGWSAIVDKRRDNYRETLRTCEEELAERILLGENNACIS